MGYTDEDYVEGGGRDLLLIVLAVEDSRAFSETEVSMVRRTEGCLCTGTCSAGGDVAPESHELH